MSTRWIAGRSLLSCVGSLSMLQRCFRRAGVECPTTIQLLDPGGFSTAPLGTDERQRGPSCGSLATLDEDARVRQLCPRAPCAAPDEF